MLEFEPVTVEMLGANSLDGGDSLIETINRELAYLAQLVIEAGRGDAGKIIVTITVRATEENGVIVTPAIKINEPPRELQAIAGIVGDGGELVTVQHRQQTLPGITKISVARGGKDDIAE